MKAALFTFVVVAFGVSFSVRAQAFSTIDCGAKDVLGNKSIHVEAFPVLSSVLKTEQGDVESILISSDKVCGRSIDFSKNCTFSDSSQENYVDLRVECYQDKNPNGRWLAIFDLSFYKTSGAGIFHCSGPTAPATSYNLTNCIER